MTKLSTGNIASPRYLAKNMLLWGTIDSAIVVVAYTIAFFLRTLADWDGYSDALGFIGVAAALNFLSLFVNGAYKRLWRHTSGVGVQVLVVAGMMALILTLIIYVPFARNTLPFSVILTAQLASIAGFTAFRYRYRLILGLGWRWDLLWNNEIPQSDRRERRLVIGAGNSGQLYVQHTGRILSTERDYTVVGFLDDDPLKHGMLVENKPVLGALADVGWVVRDYEIDLIVLAIHRIPGQKLREVVDMCQATGLPVKIMPDVLRLNANRPITELRNIQIADLIGRPSVHNDNHVDFTPLSGRVVMVTGAAGSVGSELARQLAAEKIDTLLLLDTNESGLYDLMVELKSSPERVTKRAILCDVTNAPIIEQVFADYRPQVVFHAAAYKHVPLLEDFPYEAVRTNVGGTYQVASLAQQYNAERFVLISTDKAVNSASVMGATKYLCEQVVRSLAATNQAADTLMTAVRFGNVLGSRGSVVPLFERQIRNGGPVTVTDERMTRYFMSIPEAAHLVIQAGCMTRGGDLFVLEMGESVRILELAERMIRLHNLRPRIDIPIEFIGIRPGETLHEKLIVPGETRHPTSHPHISTYAPPVVDDHAMLDDVRGLLDAAIELDKASLQQRVVTLAQNAQAGSKERANGLVH